MKNKDYSDPSKGDWSAEDDSAPEEDMAQNEFKRLKERLKELAKGSTAEPSLKVDSKVITKS